MSGTSHGPVARFALAERGFEYLLDVGFRSARDQAGDFLAFSESDKGGATGNFQLFRDRRIAEFVPVNFNYGYGLVLWLFL